MASTPLLSRIIGPVLVLRGISILIDRRHFGAMLDGLDREATTVSFSVNRAGFEATATASLARRKTMPWRPPARPGASARASGYSPSGQLN